MTLYRYEALTAEGSRQHDTIESASIRAARSSLAVAGVQVTTIRAKRDIATLEIVPKRIKRAEIMHFSRQLAAFLRGGIPLLEAFESLADGCDNPKLASTLRDMREGLREGETFSEVISAHPNAFPPV